MKQLQHLILLSITFIALTGKAYDIRVWEKVDGSQFEGRFVNELFGKLTIEDQDGNQNILLIKDLSDTDKKYIRVMIPPKIEVEVRTQFEALAERPQRYKQKYAEKDYTVTVQVDKKSQRPFTSRIKAELFLIAEEIEGDNHILLSLTTGDFLLLEENDYQYIFKSKKTRVTEFEGAQSGRPKGEFYKGHLLILSTMQGDVVNLHSNLPKWMQEPEMIENLRELYARGAASVRSRHFDKQGKKVDPPREPTVAPIYK